MVPPLDLSDFKCADITGTDVEKHVVIYIAIYQLSVTNQAVFQCFEAGGVIVLLIRQCFTELQCDKSGSVPVFQSRRCYVIVVLIRRCYGLSA